jgi:YggT family protein
VSAPVAVLDLLIRVLRPAVFAVAAVFFLMFAVDWLVRTLRISPFSPVARFFRRVVDPVIVPVQRQVVRAGGLPSSAPWWALVAVVVSGILLIVALQYLRGGLLTASYAVGAGPRGVLYLLATWAFAVLRLALIVRVVATWFRLSEFSRWIRWAVVLTEPILRPLRRVIPPVARIDFTPLVAWLLLGLLQSFLLSPA